MSLVKKIQKLHHLSFELYEKCKKERHALHLEEWELDISSSPLGEMELFADSIAGVASSICNGTVPLEHLDLMKRSDLNRAIPNLHMIQKYPLIFEYVQNSESLRQLSILFLEKKQL